MSRAAPAGRNEVMAERISAAPVRYPFSFVVVGDTGAWPDPTADGIFRQLLTQAAAVDPVFLANLGDFAGPGTPDRHRHYLDLVAGLPVPDVCVVGNHDLDDPGGRAAWADVHGPANGGGTGLCSHLHGICASDDGRPEDRGALFHAVRITVTEDGTVSGEVLQAFGGVRITFGDPHPD